MKISKKIVKIAQSFGIIIDAPIIKRLKLKKGDWVDVDIKKSEKET